MSCYRNKLNIESFPSFSPIFFFFASKKCYYITGLGLFLYFFEIQIWLSCSKKNLHCETTSSHKFAWLFPQEKKKIGEKITECDYPYFVYVKISQKHEK
jgi:hypothetical protein